jgi:2,4-didehydro-3-deoxy-L-rhamnonate hydrolase
MKLCRFGEIGKEKPGAMDAEGHLRDLSSVCDDIGAKEVSPEGLSRLKQVDLVQLPTVTHASRFGQPVASVGKILGIGLNYRDHAAEAGLPVPSEPIIFLKANTAICGPNDDTFVPRGSTKLDYEIELAVVIGRVARHVVAERAFDHVAGYCIINDVSERAFQMASSQWDKGKGCDTFAPLGPWLVTQDEIPDPQNLRLSLTVNGETRQSGTTATMVFDVRHLVSYCSQFMTLMPGDIIATGTPPGVAMGMKPEPRWLKPGDEVELSIAGLGKQRQKILGAG